MRSSSISDGSKSLGSRRIVQQGCSASSGSAISTADYTPLHVNSINDTGMPRNEAEEQINLLKISNFQLFRENFALKKAIIATYRSMKHYIPAVTGIPALPENVGTNQNLNSDGDTNQLESAMNGIRHMLYGCANSTLRRAQTGNLSIVKTHTRRSDHNSSHSDSPTGQSDFSNLSPDEDIRHVNSSKYQFDSESLFGSPDVAGESLLQYARRDREPLECDSVPPDSASYFADISNSVPLTDSPETNEELHKKRKTLRRILALRIRMSEKSNVKDDPSEKVLPSSNITKSSIFDHSVSFSSADETGGSLPILRKARRKISLRKRNNPSSYHLKKVSNLALRDQVSTKGDVPTSKILRHYDSTDPSTEELELQCRTLDIGYPTETEVYSEMDGISSMIVGDSSNDSKHSEPDESNVYDRYNAFTDDSEDQIPVSKSNRNDKVKLSTTLPEVQLLDSKSNYVDEDGPSTYEPENQVVDSLRISIDKNLRFTNNKDPQILGLKSKDSKDVESSYELESQILDSNLNDFYQTKSSTNDPEAPILISKSSVGNYAKFFTSKDSLSNTIHQIPLRSVKFGAKTSVSKLYGDNDEQYVHKPVKKSLHLESNDGGNIYSTNQSNEKTVDSKSNTDETDNGGNVSSDDKPVETIHGLKLEDFENVPLIHKLEETISDSKSDEENIKPVNKLEEIIQDTTSGGCGKSAMGGKSNPQVRNKEPLSELDDITWMNRLLSHSFKTPSSTRDGCTSVSKTEFDSEDDLFDQENKSPESICRKRKQDRLSGELEKKVGKRRRRYSE